MTDDIFIKPIGIINTPYKEPKGMPIQGTFEKGITGLAHIFPEYKKGLKDVEGFSHLIFLYFFNRSEKENLISKPFLEDEEYGIFSMRSPHRPNHIGMSIVKVENVREDGIVFSEVDMLDGTPLLDIKPYVKHFDSRDNVQSGWIDKHFNDGAIPGRSRIE